VEFREIRESFAKGARVISKVSRKYLRNYLGGVGDVGAGDFLLLDWGGEKDGDEEGGGGAECDAQ
jgi:hypothetical protein